MSSNGGIENDGLIDCTEIGDEYRQYAGLSYRQLQTRLAVAACRVLGISTQGVRGVSIDVRNDSAVLVKVEHVLNKERLAKFTHAIAHASAQGEAKPEH